MPRQQIRSEQTVYNFHPTRERMDSYLAACERYYAQRVEADPTKMEVDIVSFENGKIIDIEIWTEGRTVVFINRNQVES